MEVAGDDAAHPAEMLDHERPQGGPELVCPRLGFGRFVVADEVVPAQFVDADEDRFDRGEAFVQPVDLDLLARDDDAARTRPARLKYVFQVSAPA